MRLFRRHTDLRSGAALGGTSERRVYVRAEVGSLGRGDARSMPAARLPAGRGRKGPGMASAPKVAACTMPNNAKIARHLRDGDDGRCAFK